MFIYDASASLFRGSVRYTLRVLSCRLKISDLIQYNVRRRRKVAYQYFCTRLGNFVSLFTFLNIFVC